MNITICHIIPWTWQLLKTAQPIKSEYIFILPVEHGESFIDGVLHRFQE